MKAEAYLQIVPEFGQHSWDRGQLVKLKIAKVTQSRPRDPEPNALLLKAVVDVDPGFFAVPSVHFALDATAEEIEAAMVPVVADTAGEDGDAS